MRILVGCECSGVVREAFRAKGHDAWSCDLLPSADGSPFHLQGDLLEILDEPRHLLRHDWKLAIFHPPCDYLTNSAAWAFKDPDFDRYPSVGYHQKVKPGTLTGQARKDARTQAVEFFITLWNCGIERICIENPIGYMNTHASMPGVRPQTVQPHQFGEDASKATCLWLKGLPPLTPTQAVAPRLVTPWVPCGHCDEFWCNLHRKHASECACKPIDKWTKDPYSPCVKRWSNQTDSGQNALSPSDDRASLRAVTYQGIAQAMANQWGGL